MFFICAPGKRDRVCKKLTEKGADIMEFSFDPKGARTGKLNVGEYTSGIINRIWSVVPAKSYTTRR